MKKSNFNSPASQKALLKALNKPINKLTEELDRVFSLFIRLRHADDNGMVKCFTSGKIIHFKDAHAGHFISRRHLATRWDEKNVQVQSYSENIHNQGNAPMFAIKLDELYGTGTSTRLVIKSKNTCKMDKFEYNILIKEYKNKIENLNFKP